MQKQLTYQTRDGVTYAGDTAFQVVDAMRADSSMTEHKELGGYMKAAALRYERYNDVTPRTDTPEHFLTDLCRAGLLTKLS